ncbi:high-affinity glucose transporter RGT2 [Ilyonectria robusta]
MTYVALRSKLNADQLKPTPSRDILLIRAGGLSFLNIYRQPGTLETLDFLDSWTVPGRCLIAGDFNASHTLWQAGPHRNQGARIASWIDENDLAILNQPNQSTNKYGNILDLAISNIPTAQARVEDHLATSSDHYTLSITLPITRPTPPQPSRIRISDPEDLARLAEVVSLGRDFLTTTATTAEELDIAAAQLLDLLQDAIRIVGRCPQQNGRSAPWWTKACAKAHAQFQAAKRRDPEERGPAQLAKDDFRKVVRNAKIDFWRDIINNAKTNADIFRIAGWVRIQSAFQPPLLQVGDEVFETQIDKANALRKATLERLDAGDDIEDPWIPLRTEVPRLPFSTLVSAEEAEDVITSCVNVSSTIPGLYAIDKWGRRPLLFWGAVGMCVSQFIVAMLGTLTTAQDSVGNTIVYNVAAQKAGIAFICIYIFFFASTWGPIAWVVTGEIFPLHTRAKSLSLTTATNWLLNWAIAYSTPYLVNYGPGNANLQSKIFFIWFGACFLCVAFVYFFIYETKGLALEEVNELYNEVSDARKSTKWRPTVTFKEREAADSYEGVLDVGGEKGDSESNGYRVSHGTAELDRRIESS